MLNREALLFSPTRDGVPSSDDNFTAGDLVAAQDALEAEARDVLPFSFNQCTYDLGYIKQPLYGCLTCLNNGAVCAACSISCHGEHQLVELFNRRDFRCDCGTERLGAGSCCSLSKRDDVKANEGNKYDKNFKGVFCICGVAYDPHTETDAMYQCLVCEDWLHTKCLMGSHSDDEDAAPLGPDDFDQIVCESCVKSNRYGVRNILERWAGREGSGVMLLGGEKLDQVLGRATLEEDDDDDGVMAGEAGVGSTGDEGGETVVAATGGKREGTALEEPAAKKVRAETDEAGPTQTSTSALPLSISSGTIASGPTSASAGPKACTAPPRVSSTELSPLAQLEQAGGRANVYLEEGWRMRWCHCAECSPLFVRFPYFLEEEETYDPPDDPDAHKSTLELGMDALSRMPRAQAIEGAIAFQGLSERLKAFLRPFSESGETVTKELIDQFFASEKEALAGRG